LKSDEFKPIKSQKQVLKKLERYLQDDSIGADGHDSHSTSRFTDSAVHVTAEHGQTQQSHLVQQTAAVDTKHSNDVDMHAVTADYTMHVLSEALVAAIQCAVQSGSIRVLQSSDQHTKTYWAQAAQVRYCCLTF
jgi:ribosomal protein S26